MWSDNNNINRDFTSQTERGNDNICCYERLLVEYLCSHWPWLWQNEKWQSIIFIYIIVTEFYNCLTWLWINWQQQYKWIKLSLLLMWFAWFQAPWEMCDRCYIVRLVVTRKTTTGRVETVVGSSRVLCYSPLSQQTQHLPVFTFSRLLSWLALIFIVTICRIFYQNIIFQKQKV